MGDRKKNRAASGASGIPAPKVCAACGRTIEWRKRWERDWDAVKYCSDACRRHRPGERDAALEAATMRLLQQRGAGKTICPSEAARAVAGSDEREAWEPLMEPARAAARRLVAQNKVVISQGGVVVDASTAKGPIRIRLA